VVVIVVVVAVVVVVVVVVAAMCPQSLSCLRSFKVTNSDTNRKPVCDF